MFKACIFDLDGTLANTLESIAYSANRAIEFVGLQGNPIEDYKIFVGDGAAEMIKRSLIQSGDTNLDYYDKVKAKYDELFAVDYAYNAYAYSGIIDVLNELKSQGIMLAVLSNKPHDRTIDVIRDLFGNNLFDEVLGQKDGINRKPSPIGAYIIAGELGVYSNECIYLGDTNTDMLTGKNAGMYTIGVTWGFRDKEELLSSNADAVIDTPWDLLTIMRSFRCLPEHILRRF